MPRKKTRDQKIELITKELNEKQKLACELYSFDKECFGNKSKAYERAYNLKGNSAKNARQMAYALFTNIYVKAYIATMLTERFNPASVDRETVKVIHQDKDLKSKVQAISEYNKVIDRVKDPAANKFNFTWNGSAKKGQTLVVEEVKEVAKSAPTTKKRSFVVKQKVKQ